MTKQRTKVKNPVLQLLEFSRQRRGAEAPQAGGLFFIFGFILLTTSSLGLAEGTVAYPTNIQTAAVFFKTINWEELPKTPFETTNNYKIRLTKMTPSNDVIYLMVNPGYPFSHYFPEKEIMEISLDGLNKAYQQPERTSMWAVGETKEKQEDTNQQNVYGAVYKVENYKTQTYQLTIKNFKDLPKGWKDPFPHSGNDLYTTIPLNNAEAQKSIPAREIVIVLAFTVDDLTDAGKFHQEKTADYKNPVTSSDDYFELPVILKAALICNTNTHQVYTNWSAISKK